MIKICPRCSSRLKKEIDPENDGTYTWTCHNCGYAFYPDDPDKANGYMVRRSKYELQNSRH